MPDKVSVIIPVHNHKELLTRSFLSVKAQDYPNIECIIVDDGSTDGTEKYCEELKSQNENVVVLHQPNLRQGAARNNGIKHSSGNYIFFLDSDDWIEPNAISRLVNLIKEYKAQIAVCSCFKQTASGKILRTEINQEKITLLNQYEAFESYVFNTPYCTHSPCDKLYDVSLFKKAKFIEDSYYEDLGSVYKFIDRAQVIVHTNMPLYCYYDNLTSTMHKPFSEHEFDKVNLYHILSDFFCMKNNFKKYRSLIEEMDKLTIYAAINYIYGAYTHPSTTIIKQRIKDTKTICKNVRHLSNTKLRLINALIASSPKLFVIIWKIYIKLGNGGYIK